MLDLVPPRASFIIGARLRMLIESPMAKNMRGELRKASSEINQLVALNGFDPFEDVDEVLVAGMGEGKNASGLMIVRGRFEKARRKATGVAYRGVPISGSTKSATAFLDDTLLIAGDRALVRAAIDARGKNAGDGHRVKVADLAGRYTIYGFGKVPEGAMPEGAAGSAAKGIEEFQFGVNVTNGLDVVAEVRARTDQDAESLHQGLQLLSVMTRQQSGPDFASHTSVTREGRTLRLAVNMPEAELMKAMQKRIVAQKTDTPPKMAVVPPRDPRFARDTVLVITGSESDGGTIVITDPKKK
jgi:hypothetical protein